jgi:hypothetical protein
VLTSYGIALGAAGAVAAQEPELPAQLRAVGVSSFVLGAGCVLLAARQQGRPRAPKAEPREEMFVPAEVTTEPDFVAEVVETEAMESDEPAEVVVDVEEASVEAESRGAIPPQPVSETIATMDSVDLTAEAARLERLESELADERARVDRVTAELAALRRVVVEQRQKSSL